MSKIYLIRHGQASFLSDDYDNLSEKGLLQSKALGEYFAKEEIFFDKIYSGNLNRHQQTLNEFSKVFSSYKIELPVPIYLKEMNEHEVLIAFNLVSDAFIKQNENAKKLFDEITINPHLKKKNYITIFELFMKEYALGRYPFTHKNIQSWTEFRKQTQKGMATILKNTGKSETIGVFTSGGTKSAIIGDSLGLSEEKILELNYTIRNTAFSQLLYSKNRLNLLSLNEIPHLNKEMITFV